MPHSFSIEVMGEANPMTEALVFKTLLGASASSQQTVQVASKQLTNWESEPGYYSALQDVYANLNYDENTRFQAVIQLKNGIDRYWRKTAFHSISKQEKLKIRRKAIESGIREPRPLLALQNALVIAKIVRFEFPHDWPDAIKTIVDRLRAPERDLPNLWNTLTIALHVIKELSTARLQRSRSSLVSAAPELFNALATLYLHHTGGWLEYLQSGGLRGAWNSDSMLLSYSSIKATRRLVIAGFEHPHREAAIGNFWDVLQQHQMRLWGLTRDDAMMQRGSYSKKLISKHLTQIAKLHVDMAQKHPASFVLLAGCIPLLQSYWNVCKAQGEQYQGETPVADWTILEISSSNDEETPVLETMALKALTIFRACFKMVFSPAQTFKYQHPEDKEDRKNAVHLIKDQLMAEEFVVEMLEILVTQFFVLRTSDIHDWRGDPDEWERQEGGLSETWDLTLRGCSEKVFLDLIINYKGLLVPRLLNVFNQYASPENDQIFLKDSLYTALGLSAPVLYDKFDFNTFLNTALVTEIQRMDPNHTILRRRIAILLGQWTPVIPESISKPVVYEIFSRLLIPCKMNDYVVRVTAGRHLRHVFEPFEFSYNEFSAHATSIFQNLMALIRETEVSETKMALMETVRVGVERMECHIAPFSDEIIRALPPLWEESGNEHLMKQSILIMITSVVTALTKESVKLHVQVLPLIYDSVQPNSETITYLLDDALELWLAVVQQTPINPPPSVELLSLSHSLIALLDLGSDSLRQTLDIIESYALLSPNTVLQSLFIGPLLASLGMLIGNRTAGSSAGRREITRVTQLIETLIRAISVPRNYSDKAMQLQAGQHFISHTIESSFLASLLALIREAYSYHQTPRSTSDAPAILGPIETELFTVMARIALLSPNLFVEAISVAAGDTTSAWLVWEWIRHFDNIGDVNRKKMHALALTGLFSITEPPPRFMLDQLESMCSLWTDILTELADDAPPECNGDYLYQPDLGNDQGTKSDWAQQNEAPEEDRRRELGKTDLVNLLNLKVFVTNTLLSVIMGLGGRDVFIRDYSRRIGPAIRAGLVTVLLPTDGRLGPDLNMILSCFQDVAATEATVAAYAAVGA